MIIIIWTTRKTLRIVEIIFRLTSETIEICESLTCETGIIARLTNIVGIRISSIWTLCSANIIGKIINQVREFLIAGKARYFCV